MLRSSSCLEWSQRDAVKSRIRCLGNEIGQYTDSFKVKAAQELEPIDLLVF